MRHFSYLVAGREKKLPIVAGDRHGHKELTKNPKPNRKNAGFTDGKFTELLDAILLPGVIFNPDRGVLVIPTVQAREKNAGSASTISTVPARP